MYACVSCAMLSLLFLNGWPSGLSKKFPFPSSFCQHLTNLSDIIGKELVFDIATKAGRLLSFWSSWKVLYKCLLTCIMHIIFQLIHPKFVINSVFFGLLVTTALSLSHEQNSAISYLNCKWCQNNWILLLSAIVRQIWLIKMFWAFVILSGAPFLSDFHWPIICRSRCIFLFQSI